MHQTTFVPSVPVFYPIGNTPAVNLLSGHSPDDSNGEPVDILLLACGDPRSILYSLWSEDKPGSEKFRFTCCDLEPAILARNVMLFSLMIDRTEAYTSRDSKFSDPKFGVLWNLFYHFYIPESHLSILQKQARTLLECSETVDDWAKSPYSVIEFVTQQTLEELREIWSKYTEKREGKALATYEKTVREDIAKTNLPYSMGGTTLQLSAGPNWKKGLPAANAAMKAFWISGVVGGNEPDMQALGNKKGWVNPMAMASAASQKFAWHNSLDPLVGFHMTSAFDGELGKIAKVKQTMVNLAKEQFFEWSKAFVAYARHGSVSINFYYGDAMNFCHELGAGKPSTEGKSSITRLYAAPWSATPLALDGMQDVPSTFEIIDCSNMADWAGYLNVMAATAPLLSRKASSVLFIESLRLQVPKTEDFLTSELFMGVDVASLIFGLAPMGHILGYTTDNSSAEDMTFADCGRRHRKRISWKIPSLGDWHTHDKGIERLPHAVEPKDVIYHPRDNPIMFTATELCELFFQLYIKMFDENTTDSKPFSYYNQMSIASILQLAKRNISTDWKEFFTMLDKRIRDDQSLATSPHLSLQLKLLLKVSGVWEDCPLPEISLPGPLKSLGPRVWVFVTLVVPRSELKILEKTGGSPGLIMAIENGDPNDDLDGVDEDESDEDESDEDDGPDYFECIDCFFGSLGPRKENGEYIDVFEEEGGWEGLGDLIVTCPVPATCLVGIGSMQPQIALKITDSVASMDYFLQLDDGIIFETPIEDEEHVYVTTLPPGTNSRVVESGKLEYSSNPSPTLASLSLSDSSELLQVEIKAEHSPKNAEVVLKAVWNLAVDTPEAEALSAGGITGIVTLPDSSPCSIVIQIGRDHSRRIVFSYPVDTSKAKTRIARKSLWIEVSVPTSSATNSGGYELNPFPLAIAPKGKQPYAWSLQRFNLPKQPLIIPDGDEDWVFQLCFQMCSKRETQMVVGKSFGKGFMNSLPLFKLRLKDMFMSMNGVGGQFGAVGVPIKSFLITMGNDTFNEDNVHDTIIIGSCMRHGRETGTLLLDCWAIPFNCIGAEKYKKCAESTRIPASVLPLEQCFLLTWKRILPAAMESCRRDWKHKESCEYLKEGPSGVSVEAGKSSICSCGQGLDTDDFPKEKWMTILGLEQYATRIVVPFLSGVSYVESMDNGMRLRGPSL